MVCGLGQFGYQNILDYLGYSFVYLSFVNIVVFEVCVFIVIVFSNLFFF